MMRLSILMFVSFLFLVSCDNKDVPTVSHLESKVNVSHFDHSFFAMDSTKLGESLGELEKDFPNFFESDQNKGDLVSRFRDPQIRELFYASDSVFPNPSVLSIEITDAFKYFHYYFPQHDSLNIYTWISNFESIEPITVAGNTLLVALDLYLGQNAHFYTSAPEYIKEGFDKRYLVSDLVHAYFLANIPMPSENTLLASMVYHGKIHYLCSLLIPQSSSDIVMKYSETKMDWCIENEATIWAYFIENKLLFSSQHQIKQRFIENAPFSKFYTNFDAESPGRIAQWIGWKLVSSYMDAHPELSLNELINEQNAQKILRKSHYKPKQ
jgi:hypothetical protein